ncbi:hypothetical protein [Shinella sp. PSBB067]|uniref:hypothetical protein n=1 Tax=Shinella sp. PSBB067 TaxID=2715959 RepID=UPI001E52AE0C|nr:hypothetical protein [Shinella sp. PSBB067]
MPKRVELMRQPQFFGEVHSRLIVDTSVIINLNATGNAGSIVQALDLVLCASAVVREELIVDRINGRNDAELAEGLVNGGLLEFIDLDKECEAIFESLVSGPAVETLDDGEAATIALASSMRSIAIIDERKAQRIAAERFPDLRFLATADLLHSELVFRALGKDALANALLNSLRGARMAVPERYHSWIVELLGHRVIECRSLPATLRLAHARGDREVMQ